MGLSAAHVLALRSQDSEARRMARVEPDPASESV
jgi:hypothetical protein